MTLAERLKAFKELGEVLRSMSAEQRTALIRKANAENGWFTEESVTLAIEGIRLMLEPTALEQWVSSYSISEASSKAVGVAMAGNIPLVGFHDFLCVLVAGHQLAYKPSSKDTVLMDFIQDKLIAIEPRMKDRVRRTERLHGVDALIATGSDNTSRYFDYYFRNIPHVIRKNRVSCAIIQGDEPEEETRLLGNDIFWYYGLGCRNVSSIFVPNDFDRKEFLRRLEGFSTVIDNHKYMNNHTYQNSLLMLNQEPFLDNGFLLLKESDKLISPVSMLYYSFYKNLGELKAKIASQRDKLQVIVSAKGWFEGSLPFGTSQFPKVNDYADGVDTMKFLTSLK